MFKHIYVRLIRRDSPEDPSRFGDWSDSRINFRAETIIFYLDRCAAGYEKTESGDCEDINECDTGDATCDANNQACLNTRGSFRCLDILVSERISNCEDGFRYQSRIDQCVGMLIFLQLSSSLLASRPHLQFIHFLVRSLFGTNNRRRTQKNLMIQFRRPIDINECSEGTDDCNRKTQLCLNTRGSYKCQEKIGDKCLPGLKYNSGTKLCEGARRLVWFISRFSVFCDELYGLIDFSAFCATQFDNQLSCFCFFPLALEQTSTSVNRIRSLATMATSVSTR